MEKIQEGHLEIESHRLDFIRREIERINKEEAPPREFYSLASEDCYQMTRDSERDMDYETGEFPRFEQLDGAMVDVDKEEREGLTLIKDATFSKGGKVIFRLSELMPRGWLVIASAFIGRDFVHPGRKCIVLQRGFLTSVGGRLGAIHEIAHAQDFSENPMNREELISTLKNMSLLDREGGAWEIAKKILQDLKRRGVQWFPEQFEAEELEKMIQLCIQSHKFANENPPKQSR